MIRGTIKIIHIAFTMSLFLFSAPAWAQQTTLVSSPMVKDGWVLEHAMQTVQYNNGMTKVSFDIKILNSTGGDVEKPEFGASFIDQNGRESSCASVVYFPKKDNMSLFKNGTGGSTHCGIGVNYHLSVKSVRFFYRIGGFNSLKIYFTP